MRCGAYGRCVRCAHIATPSCPGGGHHVWVDLETVVILAATNDGIRNVETGTVALAGRDVTQLVCTGETWWALVDGGRRVLRAHVRGDWEEIARVEGHADAASIRSPTAHCSSVLKVRTCCAWRTGRSGASPRSTPFLPANGGRIRRPLSPTSGRSRRWARASSSRSTSVDSGDPTTRARRGRLRWSRLSTSTRLPRVVGRSWWRQRAALHGATTPGTRGRGRRAGCTPRTSSRSPPRATPSSSAQRAARSPRIAPFTVRRRQAPHSSGARAGSRGASRPLDRTA
jgi:hypothetical protein